MSADLCHCGHGSGDHEQRGQDNDRCRYPDSADHVCDDFAPMDARTTCEVCGHTAATRSHPCRFARGCSCWAGIPCNTQHEGRRLAAISALSILDQWDLARREEAGRP